MGSLEGAQDAEKVDLQEGEGHQELEKRVRIGNIFWVGVKLSWGVQRPPMAQNEPRKKAFRMKYVGTHFIARFGCNL